MNAIVPLPKPVIVYPESDGKPMADNTKQARWIFVDAETALRAAVSCIGSLFRYGSIPNTHRHLRCHENHVIQARLCFLIAKSCQTKLAQIA